jgi:small subunit ribosomal protein S1
MGKKDVFGDDIEVAGSAVDSGKDFGALFERSLGGVGTRLNVGDQFRGEILSLGKEEAFVSTPGTQDAMLPISDLWDADKALKYKVGDVIDVVVIKTKGGEIRVTKAGSKKASSDLDSLVDAYDMELPVEGRVLEVCNGGFRVQVQNKVAFCPVSQMDFRVGPDHAAYLNKKFDFIITQFDPKGRNLVVSRRKLLDLQKAESEGTFLSRKQPGDIVAGTVTRMEKFGAFISLGDGVEGLCHISEIGWSRLQDPSEVLSLGQTVEVKILDMSDTDGRLKISLSVKQAGGEGDPWLMVPQNFPVGSQHKGTVEKKENYGLFVNLAPGVTGLLPRSKWRDHLEAQSFETKKRGDQVQVRIDEILFDQKKMSLGVPLAEEDESWKAHMQERGDSAQKSGRTGFSNSGLGQLADLLKKK